MSGTLLLFGIAIVALILGAVGCYVASNSAHAERKRRREFEARRLPREPWYADPDSRTPV